MTGSFGLLALAMIIAPVQDVTDFERFQLFNNCEPMDLMVSDFNDIEYAENIGLTKERVQFAVESRLRGARLFRSSQRVPSLLVSVNFAGEAFTTNISYYKSLLDPASGSRGVATTWEEGSVGTHGRTGVDFILSSLSGLLDKFLTEYLRVNESACTGSPQPPTQ